MTSRLAVLLAICTLTLVRPAAAQQSDAQSFASNGVRISYSDSGSGVPVVLIHGFTGSYARHWERTGIMQAIQTAGYRVIAMDCRGHGQSDKPLDAARYGLEMVDDVFRLLDYMQIPRAHIVGYSMGGAIATQLVVHHSQRVLTATLIGSGWEGENLAAFTAEMQSMADGFALGDASGLIGRVGQGGASAADLAAATADLFARNDPNVLAAAARGMPVLWNVSRAELQQVRLPMLAIAGDNDQPALDAARRMVAVVNGMQLAILPGATHASSVRPSAEHIVEFLNRHKTRQGAP